MRSEMRDRDRAREIRKFEAQQRTATLARKLLKINSNYDPLLNPPPQAPLIWRIGAGIVGIFLLIFGSAFLSVGYQDHSWGLFAVSAIFVLASIRPLWSAIKGRKNKPAYRKGSTRK
jgi:hypothetical protein